LLEQVRDLMVYIEAGRTVAGSGDLQDAQLLPVRLSGGGVQPGAERAGLQRLALWLSGRLIDCRSRFLHVAHVTAWPACRA